MAARYGIAACAIIHASRDLYRPTSFPTFWQRIDDLVGGFVPPKVAVEVSVQERRGLAAYRAVSGSNEIRRRVPVACAKRSSASVEGRTLPPSIRAT